MRSGSNKFVLAGLDRRAFGWLLGGAGSFIVKATARFVERQIFGARRRGFSVLLGAVAVAASVLVLPGAALACVNSCPGGTIGVNGQGFPFCQGGSNAGQLVCTSGGGSTIGPTPKGIPFPLVPFGAGFGGFDPNNVPLRITGEWLQGLAGGGPNPQPVAPGNSVPLLGGPVNATPFKLSIYSPELSAGPYGTGDLFSVRNSGYRATDSAGAIPSGSMSPGFRSTEGGGGVNLLADGAGLFGINNNQHMIFGVNFNYQRANTTYGTSALTPGLSSAGSESDNIYTLTGSLSYAVNNLYVSSIASYDWNNASVTNNTTGGLGNTSGQGYTVGGTLGYVFPLLNTTGVSLAPLPTKDRPVPRYGSYALFLDVNGHAGYQKQWENGFTDSSGFALGTEQLSFTDLGAQATLIGVVPYGGGFSWMPYLGLSVDQQIGFNNSVAIPLQAASAADTLVFGQSTTFWGVHGGINIFTRAGLSVGLTGFYDASGDTQIAGGSGFVRIPFVYDAFASSSGIREATR